MRILKASEKLLEDTLKCDGEILFVGVNYDKGNGNKPHSCVIEKVEKT